MSVLLEMKLATLPRHGRKDRRAGGLEPGVIVAGDVGDATQAALKEALEEGSPVNLRFAQGDADAQQGAFAVGPNPHGKEDGAVQQLAVLTNLFIAGIQDEIGKGTQRALAPFLEFGLQKSRSLAHALTCEELTVVPQSSSTMAETLRVETPWTYISARASLRACSERMPFSKALG